MILLTAFFCFKLLKKLKLKFHYIFTVTVKLLLNIHKLIYLLFEHAVQVTVIFSLFLDRRHGVTTTHPQSLGRKVRKRRNKSTTERNRENVEREDQARNMLRIRKRTRYTDRILERLMRRKKKNRRREASEKLLVTNVSKP